MSALSHACKTDEPRSFIPRGHGRELRGIATGTPFLNRDDSVEMAAYSPWIRAISMNSPSMDARASTTRGAKKVPSPSRICRIASWCVKGGL